MRPVNVSTGRQKIGPSVARTQAALDLMSRTGGCGIRVVPNRFGPQALPYQHEQRFLEGTVQRGGVPGA